MNVLLLAGMLVNSCVLTTALGRVKPVVDPDVLMLVIMDVKVVLGHVLVVA